MHAVPNLNETKAEKFVWITVIQNPLELMSTGIQQSIVWPSYVQDKNGKTYQLRAVNPSHKSNRLRMDIFEPSGALRKEDVKYVVVFDRLGRVAYNASGNGMPIDSWQDFKPESFGDFFEVNPNLVKEVNENSEIVRTYNDSEFIKFRETSEKFEKKYGVEFAANNYNISKERLEQICREDSTARAFLDFLNKGWYLYATIPFIGASQTFIVAGIVKVVQLPKIFEDKIDRPGYRTYMPDAANVAEIVQIGLEIFANQQAALNEKAVVAPQSEHPLTQKMKLSIQGTPCKDANTYEQYNSCVLEYNSRIKK
ncbi:MAG: hypothetical protein WC349_00120 [Patescibacteria group bacterium]